MTAIRAAPSLMVYVALHPADKHPQNPNPKYQTIPLESWRPSPNSSGFTSQAPSSAHLPTFFSSKTPVLFLCFPFLSLPFLSFPPPSQFWKTNYFTIQQRCHRHQKSPCILTQYAEKILATQSSYMVHPHFHTQWHPCRTYSVSAFKEDFALLRESSL